MEPEIGIQLVRIPEEWTIMAILGAAFFTALLQAYWGFWDFENIKKEVE